MSSLKAKVPAMYCTLKCKNISMARTRPKQKVHEMLTFNLVKHSCYPSAKITYIIRV